MQQHCPNPPLRLLCFDPGETTGWAYFVGGKLEGQGQVPTKEDFARNIEDLFVTLAPAYVVCEDYRVYAHRLQQHTYSDLMTPRVLGFIQGACQLRAVPCSLQMAAVAKGFVTDDKLKAWNLYQRGMRHANDAIRHGIFYLLFNHKKVLQMEAKANK